MHQASTEQHRKIVAAVVAAAARLPKSRRAPRLQALSGSVLRQRRRRRTWRRASRRNSRERRWRTSNSRSRRRGRALVRVFNPTLREHGYTSPHTVIEMVNDDMPFLVDSIGLALTQRVAHHAFPGASDLRRVRATAPASLRSIEERAAAADTAPAPRVVPARRGRSHRRSRARCNRCARTSSAACATCAWHAPTGPRCAPPRGATSDDLELPERALRCARRERGAGAALLDGGPALHLPRLSRNTGCAAARARTRSSRWRRPGSASCAPATSARRAPPAPCASDIRRQSRSRDLVLVTKANLQSSVHRAGYLDYVGVKHFDAAGRLIGERRFLGLWTSSAYNCDAARDSAGAPQGRAGRAALRARSRQPRRQGAAAHPRVLSARRAVPGQRARSDPPGDRHLRAAGAAARAPAAAPRPVPPLLFLPGVRAAREVQHPGAPAHRARHRRGARRRSAWSRRCRSPSRISPASTSSRAPSRARGARIDGDALERRVAARGALLGGRLQDGAARALRRGVRAAAVRRPTRRRFPPPTPRISRAMPRPST